MFIGGENVSKLHPMKDVQTPRYAVLVFAVTSNVFYDAVSVNTVARCSFLKRICSRISYEITKRDIN